MIISYVKNYYYRIVYINLFVSDNIIVYYHINCNSKILTLKSTNDGPSDTEIGLA